jgi:hypothetical protein
MTLLSGVMLKPSTASLGVASWISLLRDTHVNPSAPQARDWGNLTLDTYGQLYDESFERLSPVCASLKTVPDTSSTVLTRCGKTFETWVSGLRRAPSLRKRLVPITDESAFIFLLPTPTATRYGSSQNEGKVEHKRPSKGTPSLDTMGRRGLMPTPTARDWKGPNVNKRQGGPDLPMAVRNMVPTPTAADSKGSRRHGYMLGGKAGTTLTDFALGTTDSEGSRGAVDLCLNPQFSEWLMGWPQNWTCVCGACETIACSLSETE